MAEAHFAACPAVWTTGSEFADCGPLVAGRVDERLPWRPCQALGMSQALLASVHGSGA